MHSRPRLTIVRSIGLVTASLLAISCSESVEPSRSRSVPPPSFSYSANGGALNKVIGTLNESGTRLGKGFDFDGNPHIGDAIVATFVWQSSTTTNIITSVHDNLNDANFTPVGNSYALVEFVHAGTTSMATYVATGIRGFADPAPSGGPNLAVFADLSEAVTDGGVLLVTFGGIEDAFTQALGGHHSASASGAGSQVVDAGPISVTGGAVVYTASLVPVNGLGGRALPDNFGFIATISDNNLVHDVGYVVAASAGTVNAQWSYTFNSPSSALATVISLNRAANPSNQAPTADFTSSCNALTCSFTSTSSDADGSIAGYSWNFGDGGTSKLQNPSHTYTTAGTYTATLTVTDNQGGTNSVSHSVTVAQANQSPTAAFTKSCSGLTCSFTSTSSDPDGTIASYSWNFGDGGTSTGQNPSHTYAAGGTYTVTLRVTDNQGAQSNLASLSVTVAQPNTAPVVNAGPDQTALTGLLYSSTQSFSDATPNGPWSYRIDWGDGSVSTGTRTVQGSFSVGHTYVIILPRSFTVRVTITDAAGASSSDTKVVQVLLL
jgi:PKD repeat protein